MKNLVTLLKNKGIIFSKDVPIRAAFLMQDGTYLDLHKNSDVICRCYIYPTHHDFENFLIRNNLIKKVNVTCLLENCGAIQLNDGTYEHYYECAYAHISDKGVTEEQYSGLLSWLDYLYLMARKKEVTIDMGNHIERYSFMNVDNPKYTFHMFDSFSFSLKML